MHKKATTGFTLIELSIVLVIVGLMAAAILLGQDMIKAAQARKVVSDAEKYETAYYGFRSKYNCLPGDCKNATAFFANTLDGNNDGLHYYYTSSEEGVFLVWEHLSQSGLLEGIYNRFDGPGATGVDAVRGKNTPPTNGWSGGGWTIWTYVSDGTGSQFAYSLQNELMAGGKTANDVYGGALFDEYTIRSIDQKMDEGSPGLGKVRGFNTCSTTTDPTTAQYDKTKENLICSNLVVLWGTP